MIIGTWNDICQNWVYIVLSRVNALDGLLLPNKLNDDLAKFRISDDLLNDDKRLDILDTSFKWISGGKKK